ncbi:hypothetical protein LOY97_000276 [Ophidiomyces ophidiicola]|nr:hypothetical protein LOZ49_001279 [Ophidiomyces ophidiicola]KAI2022404.1 hypothetical protein LOZ46_001887 [Ophidiomyces ophidiicola]KAI2055282.1 hypothetical protein LOZ44_002166 [Ophidiomyces ophidiicola]KAI2143351.1 hypothetical protein LOZ29_001109 [Ophidiomyces ophidiicola]KAI2146066.1 hypothetical protein LOZ28_000870 [Ophidiomyces ophidiicola]
MDSPTAPSEGIYASLPGLNQPTPQNNSESSSSQPVMGHGLGLTPPPGSQLQQDRNHLQDLQLDLQGLGDLGDFLDLPIDHDVDLNGIDQFFHDFGASDTPVLQNHLRRDSEPSNTSPAIKIADTQRPDVVSEGHRPSPANAEPKTSASCLAGYRPIAPMPTTGDVMKRTAHDCGFGNSGENSNHFNQGIDHGPKRPCFRNSAGHHTAVSAQIQNLSLPDARRYFSGNAASSAPGLQGNTPQAQSTSTLKDATLSSGSSSTSGFVALSVETRDVTNTSRTNSVALSLPPFSPNTTTPSLPTDLDTTSSRRESSIDSLFDDHDSTTAPNQLVNPKATSPLPFPFVFPCPPDKTNNSISEHIKKVCQITESDLLVTQYREAAWSFRQPPKYISPYPKPGGDLGYLPSSPYLHVKFIKASDSEVATSLEECRKKLRLCSSERDKFSKELQVYTHIDPVTKKSQLQMLKDELKHRKRAATDARKRETQAKEEATFWKKQYTAVAQSYNQMCTQFHQLRRFAHDMQTQLQRVSQLSPMAIASNPQIASLHTPGQPYFCTQNPQTMASHPQNNATIPMTPASSSPTTPAAIDLTVNDISSLAAKQPEKSGVRYSCSPEPPAAQKELISSMRKKEYRWLGNNNHMHQRFTNSLTAPLPQQPYGLSNPVPTSTATKPKVNKKHGANNEAVTHQNREPFLPHPNNSPPISATTRCNIEGNKNDESNEPTQTKGIYNPGPRGLSVQGANIVSEVNCTDVTPVDMNDDDEFARMLEQDLEASV